MFPRYTSKELSKHSSASDCWVAVHGKVLNVTDFIRKHPGGMSALTKNGRAGHDVTKFFDNVQHSATAHGILDTLQIGILTDDTVEFENEDASESAPLLQVSVSDSNTAPPESSSEAVAELQHKKEYSIRWHAARRKAILRDHPEVAGLAGSNPWTWLIGVLTVLVHCYTCIICQNWSWYWSIVLSYTVGAICKMFQFAVCHDVCHDTAGSWLQHNDLLKRTALQIFTLPGMGGSAHTYYDIQHIGHHASLGSQAMEELAPNKGSKTITPEQMSKALLFPDGDGDLFAVGTLSLGSLLQRWELEPEKPPATDEETGTKSTDTATTSFRKLYIPELPKYHREYKLAKCVAAQIWHMHHHAVVASFFLMGLGIVPPFCLLAFIWPEWSARALVRLIDYLISLQKEKSTPEESVLKAGRVAPEHKSPAPTQADTGSISPGGIKKGSKPTSSGRGIEWNLVSEDVKQLIISHTVRISGAISLHAYLYVILNFYLLFGGWCNNSFTFSSVCKGFLYLYLSDLYLYGFGMHPYLGYFLGVHRSGGRGFAPRRSDPKDTSCAAVQAVDMADVLRAHPDDAARLCQPTMSTYSLLSALATMNLTYHVEHHDFPGVPWSRLPQITQLAPEYYHGLEQSPSLWYTVYQWVQHSDGWGYACQ